MSSYENYYPQSRSEIRTVPVIPAPCYYSTLNGYTENEFGFMKFNPPLSAPVPYLYERKNDPVIAYVPSYNTLSHTPYKIDSIDYASISNAYPTKENYEKKKEKKVRN